MNISPARWTRRGWIAAFATPLVLSLALTACAPTWTPKTQEERDWADCIETITEANQIMEWHLSDAELAKKLSDLCGDRP